ncbi:unnamed protein product [Orchesella dallaii]|uniref:BTB domain-containing protein n=1 Tax=Orchesella dallaii TaxID=48710 RepID=A0ABP1QLS7_9HEXA
MTKSTPTTFKFSWSTQQSHILEGLKSLAIGESSSSNAFLTDVTLACEGEYIEAHRLVLSLCSSFFKDLFYQNERISDKAHGIVILSHVSVTDLRYILQFMYQGSVHIPKEHVDGFLQAGTLLKVEGLMSATGVAIGISDKAPRVTTPSSSANPCPKSKKPSSPDVKPKKRRRKSSSVSGNGSDDDNEAHGRVEVNVKFERPFRDATSTPFDDNDGVEDLEEAEILHDFGDAGDSDVGGASEVDGSGDENEGAALNLNLPEPSANRLENQATVTPKRDDGSVVRAGGRRPKNNQEQSRTTPGEPGTISLSGTGESGRRLSLRHPIWTLFSFDFRTNTSCCLITGCGTTLSGKFTTNLKKHLRCHHPQEFRTFITQYNNSTDDR